jgi:hypothetical protein
LLDTSLVDIAAPALFENKKKQKFQASGNKSGTVESISLLADTSRRRLRPSGCIEQRRTRKGGKNKKKDSQPCVSVDLLNFASNKLKTPPVENLTKKSKLFDVLFLAHELVVLPVLCLTLSVAVSRHVANTARAVRFLLLTTRTQAGCTQPLLSHLLALVLCSFQSSS